MIALPNVLAGPIVRRIEPRLASFWIALSRKAKVRAHLWENAPVGAGGSPDTSLTGPAWMSGELTDTVRAGEHLWVVVATVRLDAGTGKILRPATAYSYNIELQFDGAPVSDLAREGLLRDEEDSDRPANNVHASAPKHLALGYVEGALPSFVTLPTNPEELRIAHTSCRKAHGPGYDALAWLDKVIEDSRTDLTARPQAVFLTGDQIYADDVPSCLLPQINALGMALLGRGQAEAAPTGAGPIECSLANFPARRRQLVMSDEAHFTSTSAASHLMSFAEFAATYLLAWSPRVWQPIAAADEVFRSLADMGTSEAAKPMLTDWEKCLGGLDAWKKEHAEAFGKDVKNVELFRDGVRHVARALANTATYMICDDHEVTDDWNLNGKWFDRVYSRDLGKWVVANGLMAFGLFQGWGNDPLSFTTVAGTGSVSSVDKPRLVVELATPPSGYGGDLAEVADASGNKTAGKVIGVSGQFVAIEYKGDTSLTPGTAVTFAGQSRNGDFMAEIVAYTAATAPAPGPTDRLANLCGFGAGAADQQARWHYGLSGPTYRIVVMDSRTHRKFPDRFFAPPSLLGDTLAMQIPDPAASDQLLVLVSPAPVMGPDILDRMMQPLVTMFFDVKSSTYNRLVDHGIDPCKPQRPVVGAEQYDAEGWGANEAAQEALLARIARYKRAIVLGGDVHYGCSLQMEYWRKGQESAPDRIAFFTCSPAHNNFDDTLAGLARQSAALQRYEGGEAAERMYWEKSPKLTVPPDAGVAPGRRARLARSPAIVPAAGWPASVTLPGEADKMPNGRWRMRLVRDERPSAAAPEALKQPALAGEFADASETQALAGFSAMVNRHLDAGLAHFDHLRQIVFPCNLGLVRVETDGAANRYKATHTLLTRRAATEPNLRLAAENTVHAVSLEKTGEAAPVFHPRS